MWFINSKWADAVYYSFDPLYILLITKPVSSVPTYVNCFTEIILQGRPAKAPRTLKDKLGQMSIPNLFRSKVLEKIGRRGETNLFCSFVNQKWIIASSIEASPACMHHQPLNVCMPDNSEWSPWKCRKHWHPEVQSTVGGSMNERIDKYVQIRAHVRPYVPCAHNCFQFKSRSQCIIAVITYMNLWPKCDNIYISPRTTSSFHIIFVQNPRCLSTTLN